MTVSFVVGEGVAVVTIDNPPVNALDRNARERLLEIVEALDRDSAVRAVIVSGAGKVFVAGADINEFDRPVEPPFLPDVFQRIEDAAKPWIAAIGGPALGGGLELALACRYRLATSAARFALPEVRLGIIPGAGGTQRLPRLIGVDVAVEVCAENLTLDAAQAASLGLIDRVVGGELIEEAIRFGETVAEGSSATPASRRPVEVPDEAGWDRLEGRVRKSARSATAPLRALEAVQAGIRHGFETGAARERELFLELRASEEAAALRYLFFAERAAQRPADLKAVAALPLSCVGVVGGGTMGSGIAVALANAGYRVVLVERDDESLARGRDIVRGLMEASAKRAGLPAAQVDAQMEGIAFAVGYAALADCDLVIEAVFEDLAVKRAVFAELARVCRPDAILATNTSYLDPRLIVEGLPALPRTIGIHFFSPAHVMKLLEIVVLPQTSAEVLATTYELARRLGKMPVRAGICDGFIGNRILKRYRAEAEAMLAEGLEPTEVDAAMRGFGFAMGPFEMQDMAGLDIAYLQRQAARQRGEDVPETIADRLVEAGRKGRKTGAGWYDYAPGDRTPRASAVVGGMIGALASKAPASRDPSIAARLVAAMAQEGEAILAEGIASTAADIDLVEVHGYGFPRMAGGPMFWSRRQR